MVFEVYLLQIQILCAMSNLFHGSRKLLITLIVFKKMLFLDYFSSPSLLNTTLLKVESSTGNLILFKRELALANSLNFPILHPAFFNSLLITKVLHHFPMKNFKMSNAKLEYSIGNLKITPRELWFYIRNWIITMFNDECEVF